MCCKSVWQILLWTPEYPSGARDNDLTGKETINQSILNQIKYRKKHTRQTQVCTVPAKTWYINTSWMAGRAAWFRFIMLTIRQRMSDWNFNLSFRCIGGGGAEQRKWLVAVWLLRTEMRFHRCITPSMEQSYIRHMRDSCSNQLLRVLRAQNANLIFLGNKLNCLHLLSHGGNWNITNAPERFMFSCNKNSST